MKILLDGYEIVYEKGAKGKFEIYRYSLKGKKLVRKLVLKIK